MAITKIHPIKATLNLAIEYITDTKKTDEQILVSTNKCHPASAHTQFLKRREEKRRANHKRKYSGKASHSIFLTGRNNS